MAQDLRDLGHRCAGADHLSPQGVAQQMRASDGRLESGSAETRANDGSDSPSSTELAHWGATAEEDPACGDDDDAVVLEICAERLPDIRQQGQAVHGVALAADDNLSRPPPDVVELESGDLTRAQAETDQQEEDGAIATPGRRAQVAGVEQLLYLRRR